MILQNVSHIYFFKFNKFKLDWKTIDPIVFETQILKSESTSLAALAQYLLVMQAYYMCWNDNNGSIIVKLSLLQAIKKYFAKWTNNSTSTTISKECCHFIIASIDALEQFTKIYEEIYGMSITCISILGTNVVENFFNIICWKVQYPNFWQYAYTYHRAWIELIKKFALDRPYSISHGPLSKNYNNQHGLAFWMEDTHISQSERRSTQNSTVLNYKGTEEDSQLCEELVHLYPCINCRLTIRQAFCKSNPLQKTTLGK